MTKVIKLTKYLCILLVFTALQSICSVYATWIYDTGACEPKDNFFSMSVDQFIWDAEEILPSESPGENYVVLLGEIMESNQGGLNGKKDTLLRALKKYGVVHSAQKVEGGHLKHMFITEDSKLLDFVVHQVSETEIHLYVYEDDEIMAAAENGGLFVVYKTVIKEIDGEWVESGAILGYAAKRHHPTGGYYTLDPSEWQSGYIPN